MASCRNVVIKFAGVIQIEMKNYNMFRCLTCAFPTSGACFGVLLAASRQVMQLLPHAWCRRVQ
jgi:hypothetical protein